MKKLLSTSIILMASTAHATVGTNDFGYGVVSKGMAGTGVAQAQNAFTAAVNPSALSFLTEDSFELGFDIFSPRRYYSANAVNPPFFAVAPGRHDSGSEWFLIPNIGFVKRINDTFTTGISFYANGGMNTNWGDNFGASGFNPNPATNTGVFGFGKAGGELRQMFVNIPLAVKVSPNFSVGASFLTAIETVTVRGLNAFASLSIDGNNFSNRFTSVGFGFGAILSAMARVNEMVSVGGSYQTKVTPSQLSAYRGLFPNGRIEIPARASVGVSIHPNESTVVNLDYQHIWYQDTRAFGNLNNCNPLVPTPCLGTPNGAGFGFENTNGIKVGGQWVYNPDWTFRAGYAYNNNPIRSSQVLLNIIAPAVTQHHFTVGLTRNLDESNLINASFLFVPTSKITGPNPYNPAQSITLGMHQYSFGLSWTKILDKKVEVTK